VKLLVVIISSLTGMYRERRQAVRETWLTRMAWPYFFFTGQGETDEKDLLVTPFNDSRGWNNKKAHFAYTHAVANYEFDFMFRVDDDTYVVPERIPSLFWEPKAEMIGGDCMWHWGWSTGGAGLLFSRRLVEAMVKRGVWEGCKDGDDGWACACAREAGAKFYWTPRLRHQLDIRPHPNNDMVTGHYLTPKEMRVLHNQFHPDSAAHP